jgi:hypothetical protein
MAMSDQFDAVGEPIVVSGGMTSALSSDTHPALQSGQATRVHEQEQAAVVAANVRTCPRELCATRLGTVRVRA